MSDEFCVRCGKPLSDAEINTQGCLCFCCSDNDNGAWVIRMKSGSKNLVSEHDKEIK